MPIQNTQVYTGNVVEVSFDGVIVGLLQSLRANEDLGLQEVSGVGNAKAVEYAPGAIRYSLNASFMVMRTQSLESVSGRRIASRVGNDALDGLVFDINIRRASDKVLLKRFVSASYGGGDIEVNKHTILGRNVNFMALDTDGDFLGGTYPST